MDEGRRRKVLSQVIQTSKMNIKKAFLFGYTNKKNPSGEGIMLSSIEGKH